MTKPTTQNIVFIALFAALTFVATTIKIPLPTGAFVHLGNAVLVLSVLLLGYTSGSLAGGIGFFLFDLLNGYATEAPYFLIEAFIVGGATYLAFNSFKKHPTRVWQIVVIGLSAGVAKIIMTQIKNTIVQLWVGVPTLDLAFKTALVKLPATFTNVGLTILVVGIVYFPLSQAFSRIIKRKI